MGPKEAKTIEELGVREEELEDFLSAKPRVKVSSNATGRTPQGVSAE